MDTESGAGLGESGLRRLDVLFVAANCRSLIVNRGALIQQMSARGLKVGALVPRYEYSDEVEVLGIPVWKYNLTRHSTSIHTNVAETIQLYRAIRRLRPAAVFVYSVKPIIFGTPVARLAGVPNVFCLATGLGLLFTGSGWKARIGRSMFRTLYGIAGALSSLFIFQNHDDHKEISRSWLFRRRAKAIVVGGSGVDIEAYPYCNTPTTPITFIFMARLLKEKGVLEYAQAAALVRARYPNTRFLLLGGLDPSLRNAIAQEDLEWIRQSGAVEVIGRQRDVRPYLAQSSVFVLPSYYREGIPRSILEALSTGRAIITCDVPGCRETVAHGQNGWLVPARDVDALAKAMCTFVADPGLAVRMGQNSRKLAEEHFDVRLVNESMLTPILAALRANGPVR